MESFSLMGDIIDFIGGEKLQKNFPKNFLYVEFLNRFDKVAEDNIKNKNLLIRQLRKLNQKKLQKSVKNYGKESTKKKLQSLLFQ